MPFLGHWVHWVHWAAAGALARAGDEGSVGKEERVTQRVLSEDSLRERMAAASS